MERSEVERTEEIEIYDRYAARVSWGNNGACVRDRHVDR